MLQKYVVGIDEAGRGPLAGPVSVAVVALPKKLLKEHIKLFSPIDGKDSKKLTEKARKEWFEIIRQQERKKRLLVAHSFVTASVIDKKGIVPAIKSGITRSLDKLKIDPNYTQVLLDGSLKAPIKYKKQKTIIRGDETELSIRLASIVAKVLRDNRMERLSKRYFEYEFEKHKGYGTKKHIENIKKNGLCFIHRKTFCKSFIKKTSKGV